MVLDVKNIVWDGCVENLYMFGEKNESPTFCIKIKVERSLQFTPELDVVEFKIRDCIREGKNYLSINNYESAIFHFRKGMNFMKSALHSYLYINCANAYYMYFMDRNMITNDMVVYNLKKKMDKNFCDLE